MKNSEVSLQKLDSSDAKKRKDIWKRLFMKRAHLNLEGRGSGKKVKEIKESEASIDEVSMTENSSVSTLTYFDFC
jgi:hypothetical protein